jgi:hypothetical protein
MAGLCASTTSEWPIFTTDSNVLLSALAIVAALRASTASQRSIFTMDSDLLPSALTIVAGLLASTASERLIFATDSNVPSSTLTILAGSRTSTTSERSIFAMDSNNGGSTFGGRPPSIVMSVENGRNVSRLQVKRSSLYPSKRPMVEAALALHCMAREMAKGSGSPTPLVVANAENGPFIEGLLFEGLEQSLLDDIDKGRPAKKIRNANFEDEYDDDNFNMVDLDAIVAMARVTNKANFKDDYNDDNSIAVDPDAVVVMARVTNNANFEDNYDDDNFIAVDLVAVVAMTRVTALLSLAAASISISMSKKKKWKTNEATATAKKTKKVAASSGKQVGRSVWADLVAYKADVLLKSAEEIQSTVEPSRICERPADCNTDRDDVWSLGKYLRFCQEKEGYGLSWKETLHQ